MTFYKRIVRELNRLADTKGKKVKIIKGSKEAPKLSGETFYYTTLSGKTIIRHPNAYKWKMWYHPSTISLTVGEIWLNEYLEKNNIPKMFSGFEKENGLEIGSRGRRIWRHNAKVVSDVHNKKEFVNFLRFKTFL